MKKRSIALFLMVVTLLGILGTAYAVEPRASSNLSSYYVTLTAKGNGKMSVGAIVNGVGEQDKIGVKEIYIEYKTSPNGKWTYFDSLYGSEHPEFYVYNEYSYVDDIYFDGVPGNIYRVTVTAYAKKGTKSDTGDVTSASATCK